jgi:hypothetical protein
VSGPRNAFSVTACASSASKAAAAYRSAVEEMSPRFASRMKGTSSGTDARRRSSAAMPALPKAS